MQNTKLNFLKNSHSFDSQLFIKLINFQLVYFRSASFPNRLHQKYCMYIDVNSLPLFGPNKWKTGCFVAFRFRCVNAVFLYVIELMAIQTQGEEQKAAE